MSNSESTEDALAEARRNKVQQWLMEEGWQVGLRILPDTVWVLTCEDQGKRHITIVQETGRKDRIAIVAALSVGAQHQERLNQLPQKERRELIFELRQAIILLDVGYAGIQEPLKQMIFDQRIYDDGLSKDAFLQRITKVRNASVLAVNIIAQHLSEPPPAPQEEKHIGFVAPKTLQ